VEASCFEEDEEEEGGEEEEGDLYSMIYYRRTQNDRG
jgi:hypothetical protein